MRQAAGMSDSETANGVRRRIIGWCWLVVWLCMLWSVHAPWRDLGGLVSEQLRWLERFGLGAGLILGCFVGSLGRDAVSGGRGHTHRRLLRRLWLPPAAAAMVAMLWLDRRGLPYHAAVVCNVWLAYWGGLDIGFGAWPLASGRAYAFSGPIQRQAPNVEVPPE